MNETNLSPSKLCAHVNKATRNHCIAYAVPDADYCAVHMRHPTYVAEADKSRVDWDKVKEADAATW